MQKWRFIFYRLSIDTVWIWTTWPTARADSQFIVTDLSLYSYKKASQSTLRSCSNWLARNYACARRYVYIYIYVFTRGLNRWRKYCAFTVLRSVEMRHRFHRAVFYVVIIFLNKFFLKQNWEISNMRYVIKYIAHLWIF